MTTYDRDPQVAEQQHRVEETRAELGATVAALAARADVRARAQQKAGQLKAKAREATPDAAVHAAEGARRHPLTTAVGATAAGVAAYAVYRAIRSGNIRPGGRGPIMQRRTPGIFGGRGTLGRGRLTQITALPRRTHRGTTLQRALGITPGRGTLATHTTPHRGSTLQRLLGNTPSRGTLRSTHHRGTTLQRALGITPRGGLLSGSYRGPIQRGRTLGSRTTTHRGNTLQRALGITPSRGTLAGRTTLHRGNTLQRALGITPRGGLLSGSYRGPIQRGRTLGSRTTTHRGNTLQRTLGITPGGMRNGRGRSFSGRGISGAVPTRQRKAIKRTLRRTGSSGVRF
ncbi:hypothetical protein Acsp04_65790 [Actinomadura sp. NBRC 104425]|uniref:DUF3618 domain-containing protein n=1 Tax=Actinomadura sp. NBRC 104425 TaxID=3032204 RepID=UPI0024A3D785|nr:DUF3618 domain-containing protein [Actinomadura sp. NBRC 104425]GLZ16344.1 hypothetical protein Acsp04_65790 [Actinomadura sp. NBRC 104425]